MPFLQLGVVQLTVVETGIVQIGTYQDDDEFGLARRDGETRLAFEDPDRDSIYRTRELRELPLGEITAIVIMTDARGIISEVQLTVAGFKVQVRAGEILEDHDGSLRVVLGDESILVQVDGQKPKLLRT